MRRKVSPFVGTRRDGRDNQCRAEIVSGVVLEHDYRPRTALLAADIRVKVCDVDIASAVIPIFIHSWSSPFLSFYVFQCEKCRHIQVSLAVISIYVLHFFFSFVVMYGSLFVLDAPRATNRKKRLREIIRRRLADRSIGIQPPPGSPRAAPFGYGSIIIPGVCHCRHRKQSGFYLMSVFARSKGGGHGALAKAA